MMSSETVLSKHPTTAIISEGEELGGKLTVVRMSRSKRWHVNEGRGVRGYLPEKGRMRRDGHKRRRKYSEFKKMGHEKSRVA